MKNLAEDIISRRHAQDHGRNRMGCDENWYDPYYAVANTFTDEELKAMPEQALKNLLKLAETIGDALY